MEQISIKALDALINCPEVEEIINMADDFSKKYEDCYKAQRSAINNFNLIVQFLVENPDKELKVFIEKDTTPSFTLSQLPTSPITGFIQMQPQAVTKEIYLYINKNGFALKDTTNSWGGLEQFREFTPIEGMKANYSSFLKTIFGYPGTYEMIFPHLSENGKDLFEKLKTKYHSLYFNQISDKWANYKVGPLSEEEKKAFNYITDNASLTLHSRPDGVNIFIGNDRAPRGTERPSFNNNIFRKSRHDKQQFVYEKIFLINHYNDIKYGLEAYKRQELSKIDSHLEFIHEVNLLISKFVILKQL